MKQTDTCSSHKSKNSDIGSTLGKSTLNVDHCLSMELACSSLLSPFLWLFSIKIKDHIKVAKYIYKIDCS